MATWLPLITHLYPGSGITVFTVWDTPYQWWIRYSAEAESYFKAQEKRNRELNNRR